jgi:hypothetical protein
MFNDIFNINSGEIELTLGTAALTILTAFALGIVISLTHMKTNKKKALSQGFTLTMAMIPSIIAVIILLVGSNIARAFSLSGAFAIIRFRSYAADPKDITYVLFAMAAGLACGVGLFGYAAFFTVLMCLFMIVLNALKYGAPKTTSKQLKITIPEDLDYEGVFDEVFKSFNICYELKKVKTTDLGTLYELVYTINLRDDVSQKELLDAIRCRNGNLNIVLSLSPETAEY